MNTLDKFLKNVGLSGIFLVPFIPLFVSTSMFFPFITGKNFAFRIIVLIASLAWAILAIRNPDYRPQKSLILTAVVTFMVIVGISDLFGVNSYRSFWSNYERMEGYIGLLHVFLYFLLAITLLNKERLWGWLIHISLFVAFLLSMFGFAQMFGWTAINQGGVRVDATFGNATYCAIYMAVHFFLALLLVVRSKANWPKYFYGVSMLLSLIILYHTATRGAILGLVAGAFVTALIIGLKHGEKARRWSFGAAGVLLVLVLMFFGARKADFIQKSPVLSRFANISIKDSSTLARFTIWGMAYDGWKEHPVLGYGQENFNLVFNKYYKAKLYAQEAWFDRAHNIYVEWFVVGGLLGGLSYLALFGALLYLLWKKSGDEGDMVIKNWGIKERAVLTGAIVAYMINNFFVFDNLTSLILFFSILAVVHMLNVKALIQKKDNHALATSADPFKMAGMVFVVIAAVFVFWMADVKPIRASRTLIRAMSPQQEKGPTENLNLFQKALAFNTFGSTEVREQFVRFAMQAKDASGLAGELKTKILNAAEEAMKAQVQETPNDARYRLFLGNYYLTIGRADDAIRELTKAVELSPNKQQMYVALTAGYVNKGDMAKAVETARVGYELDTSNNESLANYVLAAIYSGNNTLADELISRLGDNKSVVITDNRFFGAYLTTKKYDKLLAIWQERVKMNPKDPQNYLSLAASYIMTGSRDKAISSIQQAISLDSKFKQQGDYLISEIRAGRNPVESR